MKTRLTIAMGVMTATLFVLVPSASPKHGSGGGGGGQLLPLSTLCTQVSGTGDNCSVTAVTGLSSRARYQLEVVDPGCGSGTTGVIFASNPTAAQLAAGVSFTVDDGSCGASTWTVNLYSSTSNKGSFGTGTLIGTGPAADLD